VPTSPVYTMRRTWPDNPESPNDFVFRYDGVDVGRCYLTRAAGSRDVWLWTVYGTSRGGMEDALDEAKRKFKETFEAARTRHPEGAPRG
jgi:hypothetical protein